MIKFQRNYKLDIYLTSGQVITIAPPLTVQFTINRSVNATTNTMDIAIYNLGLATRKLIFHDPYDFTNYTRIVFQAGYGNQLKELFVGNIFEANSVRQGSNLVTNITARSGFYDVRMTNSYQLIKSGANVTQVLQALIGDLPHLNKNPVLFGLPPTQFPRGVSVVGNTWDKINELAAPLQPYIDNERVFIIPPNGVLSPEPIAIIDASTGGLETPRRNDTFMSVRTLFEPNVQMGQQIQVNSTVEPTFNGQYKVLGIQHQGIISEAVNGELSSTFSLFLGTTIFGYYQQVPS